MKTEPIPVIVTEPGKGKRKNPYKLRDISTHWHKQLNSDFEANNPIRYCIDSKGNALPVRDEPYLCKQIVQESDEDGNGKIVWRTISSEANAQSDTRIAYQLIDDEVKGERPNHTCWHVPETSPCEACEWEAEMSSPVNEAKEVVYQEGDTVYINYSAHKFDVNQGVIKDVTYVTGCWQYGVEFPDTSLHYFESDQLSKQKPVLKNEDSNYLETKAIQFFVKHLGDDALYFGRKNDFIRAMLDFANYRATHPIENKGYSFSDLVKAANLGGDFQSATADTIKFDTVEDMIDANFKGIENKEGVKSAEEFVDNLPHYIDSAMRYDIREAIEAYHAQFTPIEQVKRMVDEPVTEDYLISIGFKRIPHFTVTNSLVYDIGRKRHLSIGSVGTPNEMLWLCQAEDSDLSNDLVTDLVCLHNWDYDKALTIGKLQELITALKPSITKLNQIKNLNKA